MSRELRTVEPDGESDETDWQPFINYLQSQQGHEIASRILAIVEDVKKSTLEKTSSHAKFEKWLQLVVIVVVVIATSTLSYFGKFETSVGVLFGAMVGTSLAASSAAVAADYHPLLRCQGRVPANPSLHPTCYSGLRPLPQAGELKR